MLAEFWSGEVGDGVVEGDEDAVFVNGKAEQIGVGDLVVAEDSLTEGGCEVSPAGGDGPVAIAGMAGDCSQNAGGLVERVSADFWVGGDAKESSLRKCAHTPIKTGGVEPVGCRPVVCVFGLGKGNEHVDVEKEFRLRQGRLLPRLV